MNIPPLPCRGNSAQPTELSRGGSGHNIRVTFNFVLATSPGPGGVPGEDIIGDGVDGCALLAGGGRVHPPEIVVDGVRANHGGIPLAAHLLSAESRWESGCGRREG